MKKSRIKMPALETIQYLRDENIHDVLYFFEKVGDKRKIRYQESLNEYAVFAAQGDVNQLVVLNKGDYIRRDLDGTYYVVPENYYLRNYEEVEECHLQIDQEE